MKLSHIKSSHIASSGLRSRSREQKKEQVIGFLQMVEKGRPINLINTLYGYTVAAAPIPLHSRMVLQLKQIFGTLEDLLFDKALSAQLIVMMIMDALDQKRLDEGRSQPEKIQSLLNTLQYSMEEAMMNPHFIEDKWRRQDEAEIQRIKNEQMLRALLEEEKRENKKKADDAEAQGWECPICISQIDRDSIGILECGHIFHPQCITAYLKNKIQSNETDIPCPLEECGKVLDTRDIVEHVNEQLKQKYERFTFNKFIEKQGGTTAWCPTPGCPAAFEFDEELDNYRCPACHKHYCLKCRVEYHTGMSCQEYRISNKFDEKDKQFLQFVRGHKFKQCPKCKFWVERIEGCSTMTCKCGQEFCYHCGGTTCPHGSCKFGGDRRPARPQIVRPPMEGMRPGGRPPVRPVRPVLMEPPVARPRPHINYAAMIDKPVRKKK